jgi:membrane protease YdiL (CAAX protease family)
VPDIDFTFIAFGLVACLTGGIAITIWALALGRPVRLLPLPRLRPGAWSGREVALIIVFMELSSAVTLGFLEGIGFFQTFYGNKPTTVQKGLWSAMLAFPITLAVTVLVLFSISRTRPRHLGLTTARLFQNVLLGCLTWFPLTLATLGLFELIRRWIPSNEHPLEKLLKNQPMFVEVVLVAGVVLLVAPVLEELIFRGILLGWLRRGSLLGHILLACSTVLVGSIPFFDSLQETREKPMAANVAPLIFTVVLVAGYSWIVLQVWRQRLAWLSSQAKWIASPRQFEGLPDFAESIKEERRPLRVAETAGQLSTAMPATLTTPAHDDRRKTRRVNALAAIYGSAMLFAVFHSSAWPTPIPLFFLGLGLGWLAYRTQSLVSCITVHFLFNTVAFLTLALSVFYGEPKGKAQTDAVRPSVAGSRSTIVPASWWARFK